MLITLSDKIFFLSLFLLFLYKQIKNNMETPKNERLQIISNLYKTHKQINYFTEDCETIFSIDPESDTCEYFVTVTAPCGCCGETELRDTDLSYMLELMSETDFQEFVKHLTE